MAFGNRNGGRTFTHTSSVEVQAIQNVKTRRTFYTADKIKAARQNIEQYEWAHKMMETAVLKADQYLSLGLDFLWRLPIPQSLPRSYAVNEDMGSPLNGKAIEQYGKYPYTYDPIDDPWKIVDPTDGNKYPTNDFGAFYHSGLDKHGIFDRSKADASLLYNEDYPDSDHPLHQWGVDDGTGWVDVDGNRYTFIAYYVHWAIWGREGMLQDEQISLRNMLDALNSLRDAYLYTGDIQYARAGTVLLDRIADFYPNMDISQYAIGRYPNSHGGTDLGKAIGSIWETFIVKDFLYAYDAFFPVMEDPELIDFLSKKAAKYDLALSKLSAESIRKNIENGIVLQVYPGVKKAQIRGNNGMHQSALALAAVVYDKLPETKEWLDFNFQSGGLESGPWRVTGGNLATTLVNDVDRDGSGDEGSPAYNMLWLNTYLETADILDGFDLYPAADLYQNPKFRKMFHALYPLTLSENYTPQIGDTGSAGIPGLYLEQAQMIKAFLQYGAPIFAQLAYFLNNNSTVGMHADIFTPDQENAMKDIQVVIKQDGPLYLKSVNMAGYGFAALRKQVKRDGATTSKSLGDLWMYYGRNTGHGHRDTLNIGLHAFGVDLTPDLGYPEFTLQHPKRTQWTSNTVSHNTVVVDESKQKSQWVGIPRHFDGEGSVQLIDVEAPKVYPQTERYRRTTTYIMVDEDNAYAVDFFRIKGGHDHHFSFHGAEGEVTTEGLNPLEQRTGAYAGADLVFGEKEPDQPDGWHYAGSGFHYLRNVERDENPTGTFSIDWDIEDTWGVLSEGDDPHLRLTMLNDVDEVALADGEPPQNKPGNPESLKYLIARRNGENLNSQFISVIEPYNGERYIQSISSVTLKVDGEVVESEEAAAVKVKLTTERVDYIVNALDPEVTYTVDDQFSFKGFFGLYSEKDGKPVYGYLNDGTVLSDVVQTETNVLTGTVADFTKELSVENQITVDLDQSYENLDALVGSYIYIETDSERNGSYRIKGIKEKDGRYVTFGIGDLTLVRSYADTEDLSKGFIYNITAGSEFTIPLATEAYCER